MQMFIYKNISEGDLAFQWNLCLNITCQNVICPTTMLWVTISLKSKPCATCICTYPCTKDNLPWPCNSMELMFEQSWSKYDLLRNHAVGKYVAIYKHSVICTLYIYIYKYIINSFWACYSIRLGFTGTFEHKFDLPRSNTAGIHVPQN